MTFLGKKSRRTLQLNIVTFSFSATLIEKRLFCFTSGPNSVKRFVGLRLLTKFNLFLLVGGGGDRSRPMPALG